MTLSDSSVTRWLERLETGDDLAAAKLWNAYFDRLVHLAHGRLQAKFTKVNDAEDIALSAFHSFCRGVENKRFPELSDRDGLWRLLVSITIHKLLHVVRDQKRLKHGGQFHELTGLDSSSDRTAAVNQIVSREPSPEFAFKVAEQYQEMMLSLEDEELVQLATWKMEGFPTKRSRKRRIEQPEPSNASCNSFAKFGFTVTLMKNKIFSSATESTSSISWTDLSHWQLIDGGRVFSLSWIGSTCRSPADSV